MTNIEIAIAAPVFPGRDERGLAVLDEVAPRRAARVALPSEGLARALGHPDDL
jgi:hypothetical protein